MSPSWKHCEFGKGPPAFNMAADEALLIHSADFSRPVLRFYGWTEPAATFGYFQKYEAIQAATPLRPLIRRPTGGGLVPHASDWTYSLAMPPGSEWYELRAEESYRRIHAWIQSAFQRLEIETELADCCRAEMPGQCFAGYEKHDLLFHGRKIAGAAQRRNRLGLLIQGSIQPLFVLDRTEWHQAMLAIAEEEWGVEWTRLEWTGKLRSTTEELIRTKYSTTAYNQRR